MCNEWVHVGNAISGFEPVTSRSSIRYLSRVVLGCHFKLLQYQLICYNRQTRNTICLTHSTQNQIITKYIIYFKRYYNRENKQSVSNQFAMESGRAPVGSGQRRGSR